MTRIEFKFKIPYVVFWEIPFQTNTRLSLKKKKKKKKETQYHIKISNHLFTEQKKPKKKKIKNPKTQNVFPDQNSYSLRLQILLYSFKHTDRPWVATKTLKPKSVLPIKIQTHSDHRFFAVPSNTQIGDQNSYSLRLQNLLCSFKHTDRPGVATKTLKTSAAYPRIQRKKKQKP